MPEAQQRVTTEGYQKLLTGEHLPEEDERVLLTAVARTNPEALPGLCQVFANQRREARAAQRKADAACSAARAELARLLEPPLFPADVARVMPDGRLEVILGGRRQIVIAAPAVDCTQLQPGHEVLLNREQTAVIANGERSRTGVVATVVHVEGDHVVLQGLGDEEIVAICPPELAARLGAGDRVVRARESHCVLDRLSERRESAFLLTRPPPTTFADIGGLDEVIATIKRDLDVYLVQTRAAARYRLRPVKSMLFVGSPGIGKTSLAAAIANHLHTADPAIRFLHVAPGALRASLYGQSEARIHALFAAARRAPGMVVIFFDEVDGMGARGMGIGQDIDGRVLGALLAELDGLASSGSQILCIGATNRLDLCDAALVRPGRLGDRIYDIPRPARAAARQIFERYLTADLFYEPLDDPGSRAACVGAAVAYLYAANGGAGPLGTVTLTNGDRRAVAPADVVSGALIATAAEDAKRIAAARDPEAERGVAMEDVLAALDAALAAEVAKLATPQAARRILEGPGMDEIVRVELVPRGRPQHRFLRAV